LRANHVVHRLHSYDGIPGQKLEHNIATENYKPQKKALIGMYQVSTKDKFELELVTTRTEVPAVAREEGCSPADHRLPIHTPTAPPVTALSPLLALAVFCKQM